jgi:hypothetical protein
VRRVVLLFFALTGCNQVWDLGSTTLEKVDAAIDGPGCFDGAFSAAEPLPGFMISERPVDPQMRHDSLEVWFIEAPNEYDIFRAHRNSLSDQFGPAEPMFVGPNSERSPSLTGDGLHLFFGSNRNGPTAVWEAVRPTLDGAFAAPQQVLGLPAGINYEAFDVSFDGNTFYYSDGDDLMQVTRVNGVFGTPKLVATNVHYVSVSPDGLELFYQTSTDRIEQLGRTSTAEVFTGLSVLLYDSADDPDMSPDGKRLLFAANNTILERVRTCP